MEKHFKAIVENGYQILQTPCGERVNYLTKTVITQTIEKLAECVFSVNVNYKSSRDTKPLQYDPNTQTLSVLNGEILDVEILDYSPETQTRVPNVTARCTVIFPYETKHREPTTNN